MINKLSRLMLAAGLAGMLSLTSCHYGTPHGGYSSGKSCAKCSGACQKCDSCAKCKSDCGGHCKKKSW